ncbi:MAG: tRNA pseudouridine(13) synthase TruD [Arcobacteraceae bacterium]
MKRVFSQKYTPLNFNFYQNKDDFIVNEEPIEFTNRGNFIVLKIQKENLGTWDLLEKLAKGLNIYEHELGYAGLKDKHATTTQYISVPRKYSKDIKRFKHGKINIIDSSLHSTKLNIGDLKGNHFAINLHNVSKEELILIEQRVKEISKVGMPNFFGFQRFGKDIKENLEKAQKIVEGELKIKDAKLEKMLISAYQSNFFNKWLVKRIEQSKESFSLLNGDVFLQLKDGKFFTPKEITPAIEADFEARKIVPTGLLCGRNVFRSMGDARKIEEKYDDMMVVQKGLRRACLVYPTNIQVQYNAKEQQCKLSFFLPKASYATVLIENIKNTNIILK